MFVLFFSFLNKYKLFSFCFHNCIHWKSGYVIFANINQSTHIHSRNQNRFAVVDICMNRHRLCLVLESLTSTKKFPRNLLITTIGQDKPYSLTNFYFEKVFFMHQQIHVHFWIIDDWKQQSIGRNATTNFYIYCRNVPRNMRHNCNQGSIPSATEWQSLLQDLDLVLNIFDFAFTRFEFRTYFWKVFLPLHSLHSILFDG